MLTWRGLCMQRHQCDASTQGGRSADRLCAPCHVRVAASPLSFTARPLTALLFVPAAVAGRSPPCLCTWPCPRRRPCPQAAASGGTGCGVQVQGRGGCAVSGPAVEPRPRPPPNGSSCPGSMGCVHKATGRLCVPMLVLPINKRPTPTWHVTQSVWHSCVFPQRNSPYISVMDPVSMPPAGTRVGWPHGVTAYAGMRTQFCCGLGGSTVRYVWGLDPVRSPHSPPPALPCRLARGWPHLPGWCPAPCSRWLC